MNDERTKEDLALDQIKEAYKQFHLLVNREDVSDTLTLIQNVFLEKYPEEFPSKDLKQGLLLLEHLAIVNRISSKL